MKPWPYPRWVAHRGAGLQAPENTLAAFQLGARHGFRMFECDAKLSADGVVFLLHDATLERTTNGQGLAGDLSWEALSALDAGSWHSPAYASEPLSRLRTVGRWLQSRDLFLNIEIKPTSGFEAETGTQVAREVAQLWADAKLWPFLTSFSPVALEAAARVAPHLPRGLLLNQWDDTVFDAVRAHRHQALICHYALWTPLRLQQAAQQGLWRLSYTVNDPAVADQLWLWGHEAIITDAIDVFDPRR
ncbi:MAG: glycerophosphodiester phosphodiesterase [Alphaproteobacteria bacterium]|nr:glycerophosphodiester phosphodiesterase [Alphaproteobacteria bacterium]